MLLEARVSLVCAAARAPGCGIGYDGGGPRRAGTLTPPTPAGGFVYVCLRVRGCGIGYHTAPRQRARCSAQLPPAGGFCVRVPGRVGVGV